MWTLKRQEMFHVKHYPKIRRWDNPLVQLWRDWIVADWLVENSKNYFDSPNWHGPTEKRHF